MEYESNRGRVQHGRRRLEYFQARGTKVERSVNYFQSLMGRLLWIARCTRPGICFDVHKVTIQTYKQTVKEWNTASESCGTWKCWRIWSSTWTMLGRRQRTIGSNVEAMQILLLTKLTVSMYLGVCQIWTVLLIYGFLKKQWGASLIEIEAEFISASQADRERLGTKELLWELKLRVRESMPMWINNQAAINHLESEKIFSCSKHVDLRFKFIWHHAQEEIVVPRFLNLQDMIADMLTKALPATRMKE